MGSERKVFTFLVSLTPPDLVIDIIWGRGLRRLCFEVMVLLLLTDPYNIVSHPYLQWQLFV